jgi:hypothetical protein
MQAVLIIDFQKNFDGFALYPKAHNFATGTLCMPRSDKRHKCQLIPISSHCPCTRRLQKKKKKKKKRTKRISNYRELNLMASWDPEGTYTRLASSPSSRVLSSFYIYFIYLYYIT